MSSVCIICLNAPTDLVKQSRPLGGELYRSERGQIEVIKTRTSDEAGAYLQCEMRRTLCLILGGTPERIEAAQQAARAQGFQGDIVHTAEDTSLLATSFLGPARPLKGSLKEYLAIRWKTDVPHLIEATLGLGQPYRTPLRVYPDLQTDINGKTRPAYVLFGESKEGTLVFRLTVPPQTDLSSQEAITVVEATAKAYTSSLIVPLIGASKQILAREHELELDDIFKLGNDLRIYVPFYPGKNRPVFVHATWHNKEEREGDQRHGSAFQVKSLNPHRFSAEDLLRLIRQGAYHIP